MNTPVNKNNMNTTEVVNDQPVQTIIERIAAFMKEKMDSAKKEKQEAEGIAAVAIDALQLPTYKFFADTPIESVGMMAYHNQGKPYCSVVMNGYPVYNSYDEDEAFNEFDALLNKYEEQQQQK